MSRSLLLKILNTSKQNTFFLAKDIARGRNLWGPHRIGALKDIRFRKVVSGCCSAHSIAITDEGSVYVWG